MTSATEARKEIAAIDRQIDANRRAANDKALENDLFHLRGMAQLRRDIATEEQRMIAARATLRAQRFRKCPTCGCNTLRAA